MILIMKIPRIFICVVFFASFLKGQTIDITEFDVGIGTVLQYSGTFQNIQGTMTITTLDGNATVRGSKRGDVTISGNQNGLQLQMSTFTVNGGIVRRNVTNQYGSFVMNFSQPWYLTPRYVTVGQVYQSTGRYSYSANGITVQATMQGSGSIEKIEKIQTPLGVFEALKIKISLTNSENFSRGWSQSTEEDTFWIVKNVGIVKYQAYGSYSGSNGTQMTITSDYSITSSNRPLPSVPVYLQTRPDYDGWSYGMGSWAYSFNTRTWYAIDGNALSTNLNTNTTLKYDQSSSGFVYTIIPFYYSLNSQSWHFVSSADWLYDAYTNQVYSF